MKDLRIGTLKIINSNGGYLIEGDTFPCYVDKDAKAYIVESYEPDEPCQQPIADLIADGIEYENEANMTTNSPNPVDGAVRAHQMPAMTDSERQKNIDAIYTRMRSIAEEGDENLQFEYGILRFALVALTTPPAQLLRPVELPQSFYGVIQNGKSVMLHADDGQWLNKTAVIETLRQQATR
ncbi:hypothetical protein [Pantoea stewartii]|uniref:hypothetical protein n=1 Tax=Pantoea stewartii TaxID=66269 RepID=UPI0025A27153|nr:hypothetical protein [Pantoea stewartii]